MRKGRGIEENMRTWEEESNEELKNAVTIREDNDNKGMWKVVRYEIKSISELITKKKVFRG